MNFTSNKYSRQSVLDEIGIDGQYKLHNARVLCIGAGGLGCPALLYLVAAGIGSIGIVDFDVVSETNLQRQILFTTEQIGQNKALVAKDHLSKLNLDVTINAYTFELTDDNAEKLFSEYDIIIDGTDNFAAKFLINDVAVKCGKPLVYGSILGFDGQVSVFGVENEPCYRCLFPEPPKAYVPNCAEAGIIGAVAGIVGSQQALQVIQIIVGHSSFEPLVGKLWTIDTHNMETNIFKLSKNNSCPSCSKQKDEIVIEYTSPVCGFVAEVTPEQAIENKEALLVDVRRPEEWNNGHIDSAVHIELSSLIEGKIPDLPTNQDIILYCQKGLRSIKAAEILKANGYINVISMSGGYEAWLETNT